jgi:hypothetical protein
MQAFDEAGAKIVASGFNESFLAPENLAGNALTTAFGTSTPNYTYDQFLNQGQELKYKGKELGLLALQTPGKKSLGHLRDRSNRFSDKRRSETI